MTTRYHAADGTYLDLDEEREFVPTHINDSHVVSAEFLHPTPEAAKPAGETDAQKRDRLRAELAALGDGGPE